jgi:pimeloyl-ACP methyl ester carboxylesterase
MSAGHERHEVRDMRTERFAWREAGAADAPTVLLLHGLGGSRLSWEPQLDQLSQHYRLIAWDLPGYGDAPPLLAGDAPAALTFPMLAAAVAELIHELGCERVHLVGISFGGMIAQYVAARRPDVVRSLSLLATSAKFGQDGTDPDTWRAARLAPLDDGMQPADFADAVLSRLAGPSITFAAMAQQRAAMNRISAEALRRSIDCLVTHDSRTELASITAPTQCLVGGLDDETPVAYARYLAEQISGARLEIIPGAGHLLNAEAPEAVNDLLAGFVASVEASTT